MPPSSSTAPPGNEQNINHFYNDLQMYTDNATSPVPVSYMLGWYAGPEGENIAQASNDWSGQNCCRFQNADYDKLFEQVRLETDLEKAAELFIQMNDILINDVAVVPLVNRAADKYAHLDDAARRERRGERLRSRLLEHRQLEPEGVGKALTLNPLSLVLTLTPPSPLSRRRQERGDGTAPFSPLRGAGYQQSG